ncbi:MAG TPA: methyltransferase domain-containing protein, partial [Longimicrobiales bacterium]|nr:methyltransferase domain-containing protein [Longimicrobiales bacterium]
RSPAMLGAARDRLGDRPGVSLRQGELEALPVEDGELDLAVLLLVLHYVGDPARALSEAGRALRPGGGLLLVDMRSHGRRGYREEMGHLWPGFAPDELEGWLLDAGFDTFGHRPAPPDPEAKGPPLFVATARLGGSD